MKLISLLSMSAVAGTLAFLSQGSAWAGPAEQDANAFITNYPNIDNAYNNGRYGTDPSQAGQGQTGTGTVTAGGTGAGSTYPNGPGSSGGDKGGKPGRGGYGDGGKGKGGDPGKVVGKGDDKYKYDEHKRDELRREFFEAKVLEVKIKALEAKINEPHPEVTGTDVGIIPGQAELAKEKRELKFDKAQLKEVVAKLEKFKFEHPRFMEFWRARHELVRIQPVYGDTGTIKSKSATDDWSARRKAEERRKYEEANFKFAFLTGEAERRREEKKHDWSFRKDHKLEAFAGKREHFKMSDCTKMKETPNRFTATERAAKRQARAHNNHG